MYPFGGIIVGLLVAAYATSAVCRMSLGRARRPGWIIVPVMAVLGVFVSLAATFQTDLFRLSHWSSKVEAPFMLLITGVPSGFAALFTAAWIVGKYREKYANTRQTR